MVEILDQLKKIKAQALTSLEPDFHFRCSIGPLNYFSFLFLNENLNILKKPFKTAYTVLYISNVHSNVQSKFIKSNDHLLSQDLVPY